jgi:hypothetical protein
VHSILIAFINQSTLDIVTTLFASYDLIGGYLRLCSHQAPVFSASMRTQSDVRSSSGCLADGVWHLWISVIH